MSVSSCPHDFKISIPVVCPPFYLLKYLKFVLLLMCIHGHNDISVSIVVVSLE
jgi:hypothetical protein